MRVIADTAKFTRAAEYPVFTVAIYDGTTTWTAQSAISDELDHPIGVYRVDPIEATLDPLTRVTEIGSVVVTVADEWIRPILVNNVLLGKRMTVKTGRRQTTEADFTPYRAGVITSAVSTDDGQTVTLEAMSPLAALMEAEITGYWIGTHPLTAMLQIIATKCGIWSGFYDFDSFTPSTWPEIEHYNITRAWFAGSIGNMAVSQPVSAKKLVDELCRLCGGSIYENAEGEISFARFDATAAVDRHWTTDDYDGRVKTEPDDTIINRVTVNFNRAGEGGSYVNTYTQDDTTSQAAYKEPGSTAKVNAYTIDDDWAFSVLTLQQSINDTQVDNVNIGYMVGFACGGRDSYPIGSQPSGNRIDSSKPMYLKIDEEILKVEVMAPGLGNYTADQDFMVIGFKPVGNAGVNETLAIEDHSIAAIARLGGVTRGALGTSKMPHLLQTATLHFGNYETPQGNITDPHIYDITMAVAMATAILDRFANGCDRITVTTWLDQDDLEVGDSVSLDNDNYLSYGRDGLDSSTKFEIISKRADFYAGRITYKLAAAETATPTTRGTRIHTTRPGKGGSEWVKASGALRDNMNAASHVATGMNVNTKSLYEIAVGAGTGAGPGRGGVSSSKATDIVLPSGQDSHIATDIATGGITVRPRGAGSKAPGVGPSEVPLAKATSDGVTTTVTQAEKVSQAVAPTHAKSTNGKENMVANSTFGSATKGKSKAVRP